MQAVKAKYIFYSPPIIKYVSSGILNLIFGGSWAASIYNISHQKFVYSISYTVNYFRFSKLTDIISYRRISGNDRRILRENNRNKTSSTKERSL